MSFDRARRASPPLRSAPAAAWPSAVVGPSQALADHDGGHILPTPDPHHCQRAPILIPPASLERDATRHQLLHSRMCRACKPRLRAAPPSQFRRIQSHDPHALPAADQGVAVYRPTRCSHLSRRRHGEQQQDNQQGKGENAHGSVNSRVRPDAASPPATHASGHDAQNEEGGRHSRARPRNITHASTRRRGRPYDGQPGGRQRVRRHPHHRPRSAPRAASPAVPALSGPGPHLSAGLARAAGYHAAAVLPSMIR